MGGTQVGLVGRAASYLTQSHRGTKTQRNAKEWMDSVDRRAVLFVGILYFASFAVLGAFALDFVRAKESQRLAGRRRLHFRLVLFTADAFGYALNEEIRADVQRAT